MAGSTEIVLLSCLFLLLVIAAEHADRRRAVPAPAWMLVLWLCYGLTGRLGRGSLPASYERRTAMVCLAFALLLFSLVTYLAANWCCLQNTHFPENSPDTTGATS